mmetsp:Transcript_39217/g.38810  ORF Transcript_39217/g.38810 Transcript_39217/m.38810 type:complete len:101 (-) Transcript_39217:111-413(-)
MATMNNGELMITESYLRKSKSPSFNHKSDFFDFKYITKKNFEENKMEEENSQKDENKLQVTPTFLEFEALDKDEFSSEQRGISMRKPKLFHHNHNNIKRV